MRAGSGLPGGAGASASRLLSACLRTALMLVSVFHSGISSVKADVRCYCNLPACVASGYVCKSALGTCVSDRPGGGPWRSRHACLELGGQGALRCGEGRLCCREDMCNYFPVHGLNRSYMTGHLSNDDSFRRHGRAAPPPQPWLSAAVVAVPIAGGGVLAVLVVMATRMLRADRRRHKLWSELRRRRRITHVVYGDEKPCRLPVAKSASSAALPGLRQGAPKGSSASVGDLVADPRAAGGEASLALSADTDVSREKYFVFDL